jgi:hypothetical protein
MLKNVKNAISLISNIIFAAYMRSFAVIFFLFLCVFLFKGNNHTYVWVPHNKICQSAAQNSQNVQQTNSENIKQSFSAINNNSLSEKKEYLISVEDEDDDVVFTRKYVLLAKSFIALTYSTLIYFHTCFKICLTFCRHFCYTSSYKYILQGVLRI